MLGDQERKLKNKAGNFVTNGLNFAFEGSTG